MTANKISVKINAASLWGKLSMTLQIQAETAPIAIDVDGAASIGGTRVLLEVVIGAFQDGDSPEQIADSYDALKLADVYAVISYYLHHQEEVDAYIRQQEEAGRKLRQEIEAEQPEMLRMQKRLQALKRSKSSLCSVFSLTISAK